MNKTRTAKIVRKTTETDIALSLCLDGSGKFTVSTGIPFFDHMLSLFAKHSRFNLRLKARGDLEIDQHHTVEDIGICMGKAVKAALGNKKGIRRFGFAAVPMDESLSQIAVDISGRGYLVYGVKSKMRRVDNFDAGLVEEFLRAFSSAGEFTLHVNLLYGKNNHHIIESIFKGFGVALGEAIERDSRIRSIPSTKGRL